MKLLSKMLSNTPPPREPRELWKHFSKTYMSLRVGLTLLAFTMPFVLFLYGKFRHGLELQPSMSAYFWAAAQDQCATFPMRTIFVGFLFAMGVGLLLYKGLTKLENFLLNAASLCAFTVAIYPERLSLTEAASDQRVAQLFESCPAVKAWATLPSPPIHYMAAVILFVLLAIVAWKCADKSLEYLPTGHNPAYFQRVYRIIALLMIFFPIIGLAVAYLFGVWSDKVFFIEAAGVLMFGVYWAVKTRELWLSRVENDPVEAVQHAEQRQAVEKQAEKDARL